MDPQLQDLQEAAWCVREKTHNILHKVMVTALQHSI
jgi:hypothetical protein